MLNLGMANETEIRPALTPEQWKDLNGPMFFYGASRDDGCSFVYFDGEAPDGLSISLAAKKGTPEQERFPIELPHEDRHALAALALYGQPFGFTQGDVAMLFGIAHHFQAFPGDRAYTDRIAGLAKRIAALLPPDDHV